MTDTKSKATKSDTKLKEAATVNRLSAVGFSTAQVLALRDLFKAS